MAKHSPWPVFRCNKQKLPVAPHDDIDHLPDPPPWRHTGKPREPEPKAEPFSVKPLPHIFEPEEVELINAAIFLRRPLFVTGPPGSGKSTIAESVAYQLKLGQLLRWHINTRSTRREGLYSYDPVAQLQDRGLQENGDQENEGEQSGEGGEKQEKEAEITRYLTLGPLGTALLPRRRPRVLLIDEIDKSDVDLPNDLLDIFEEGGFRIPELDRLKKRHPTIPILPADKGEAWPIDAGQVRCSAFPIVVMTSNRERDFPAPFLRRCLRLDVKEPDKDKLASIVEVHLKTTAPELVAEFDNRRKNGKKLAVDQLLNAVYLLSGHKEVTSQSVRDALLRSLEE
jgi:MoxR-like ATPase